MSLNYFPFYFLFYFKLEYLLLPMGCIVEVSWLFKYHLLFFLKMVKYVFDPYKYTNFSF